MHKTDSIMNFGLTIGQAVSYAVLIIGGVTYVHTTFETKSDSSAANSKLERRLEKVEDAYASQSQGIGDIKSSVEYIRGRLEPRSK